MRNKHSVPFEHAVMSFGISVPIFVARELMRHRIASFSEESSRYRELRPVFYIPGKDRPMVQIGRPMAYQLEMGSEALQAFAVETIMDSYKESWESYQTLLKSGAAREVARMVLPVGIFTNLHMTINLRSLMNLLSLRIRHEDSRIESKPQLEIQMMAEQMEDFFKEKFPITHQAWHDNGRTAP